MTEREKSELEAYFTERTSGKNVPSNLSELNSLARDVEKARSFKEDDYGKKNSFEFKGVSASATGVSIGITGIATSMTAIAIKARAAYITVRGLELLHTFDDSEFISNGFGFGESKKEGSVETKKVGAGDVDNTLNLSSASETGFVNRKSQKEQ